MLELDPRFQRDINALRSLYVQSSSGQMVPVNAVAEIKSSVGPVSVNHYGQLPSVVLSFNLVPGVSIGDAVEHVQELAREVPAEWSLVNFRRECQSIRGGFPHPAAVAAGDDTRDLHGARDLIRTLRTPAHDSDRAAVCGISALCSC